MSAARLRYLQALIDEFDAADWETSGRLDEWLKLADDIEVEARADLMQEIRDRLYAIDKAARQDPARKVSLEVWDAMWRDFSGPSR